MYIKPYAKIGKEVLTRALMSQVKAVEKREVLDNKNLIDLNNRFNSYCTKCPFSKAPNEKYCTEYCDNFKKYAWSDVEFTDEGMEIKSNKNIQFGKTSCRLSRLSLLLFISLHFNINIDSRGIIKNVDFKELAEKLNCNVKSIIKCSDNLVKYGFIWISKVSTYKYSIKIVPYETYHLKAREGGKGYFNMSNEILDNLISIKDVNNLRSAILMILQQDEAKLKETKQQKETSANNEHNKGEQCKISLRLIKQRLPKHITNQRIQNIIKQDKIKEMFTSEILDNVLYFKINDKYNMENYKQSIKDQYITKIKAYLVDSQAFTESIDEEDLLQMSIQYGIDVVLEYLPIAEELILDKECTGNYCGLLRNVIRQRETTYSLAI